MASNNIIGACELYYATLGFSGKPTPLWFDGIPIKDSAGTVVTLPTVEILHGGCSMEITEEGITFDNHTLTFVIRAAKLEDAGAIARGIKYNGGTPKQFLGFDGASEDNSGIAFPLSTGQFLKGMIRQSERMSKEAPRQQDAKPVHRFEITYVAYVMVTA